MRSLRPSPSIHRNAAARSAGSLFSECSPRPPMGATTLSQPPTALHPRMRRHHFSTAAATSLTGSTIDPVRISALLARKDWFSVLKSEFESNATTGTGALNPQLAIRILRTQQNPILLVKFYTWISHFSPKLSRHPSVSRVFLDVLTRRGPVVLSTELLAELKKTLGFSITEDSLCVLIASWGRLGLANYISEVFSQLPSLGFKPTTRLYNAVIDALVKSNSLDLAYFKFQHMVSDNCLPDRFTYNTLIHGVCKMGIVEEATRLMNQMEGAGHLPNVFTYTILVDGFCKAKKIDEAIQVVERMRTQNVMPSEATYRSLIHGAFRQSSSPERVYTMLTELIEREHVASLHQNACDVMLQCLSKQNMCREAKDFLYQTNHRQKGYLPLSSTFRVVMVCLVNNFDYTKVSQVFDDYLARGGRPGFDTYHTLINGLLKHGRSEAGQKRANQMITDGIITGVVSYNVLINTFCKAHCMDVARDLFTQMSRNGHSPTIITFNTLISGYARLGDVKTPREILKILFQHNNLKPDVFTFGPIISGLCRAYQVEDALNSFNEMIKWGIHPNSVVYNIMIRSLCASGQVRKAIGMFTKMKADGITPDASSFNALIVRFCKMKKITMARNIFQSMLRFGIALDGYTCDSYIRSLLNEQQVDEAKEVVRVLECWGLSPT